MTSGRLTLNDECQHPYRGGKHDLEIDRKGRLVCSACGAEDVPDDEPENEDTDEHTGAKQAAV